MLIPLRDAIERSHTVEQLYHNTISCVAARSRNTSKLLVVEYPSPAPTLDVEYVLLTAQYDMLDARLLFPTLCALTPYWSMHQRTESFFSSIVRPLTLSGWFQFVWMLDRVHTLSNPTYPLKELRECRLCSILDALSCPN